MPETPEQLQIRLLRETAQRDALQRSRDHYTIGAYRAALQLIAEMQGVPAETARRALELCRDHSTVDAALRGSPERRVA